MTAYQYPLCLPPNHPPPQPDPERIREQLAAEVEQANAATDPGERCDLHRTIIELRVRLAQSKGNQ